MKKAISSVIAITLASSFVFAGNGVTHREIFSKDQVLDSAKKQEIMGHLIQNDQIHVDVEYKSIKSGFRGNAMVTQKADALKRAAEKIHFKELRPLQEKLEAASTETEKKAISAKIYKVQKQIEALESQQKTLTKHLEVIEKARAAGKESVVVTEKITVTRIGDSLAESRLNEDMWPANAKIVAIRRLSVNDVNNLKKMNTSKNLTKGLAAGLALVGAGTAGYFMMDNTEVKAIESQDSFEKAKSSVRLRDNTAAAHHVQETLLEKDFSDDSRKFYKGVR